jgi:hypothetical protein
MRTRWLAVVSLLVACQALPSPVPLANTGGVLDDDGTARDRRAPAREASVSVETAMPSAASSLVRGAPTNAPEPLPSASASAAPSNAADAGTNAVGWAGEYYGSDKLVRHFEGDADDVELDEKAHTRVEEPSAGSLLISIVNSATGDTICALKASARGTEATVSDGQSCFSEQGAMASLTSGRATLAGARLVLDFSGKVVAEADDDGDTIEFGLEYHFDGQRR